MPPLQPNASDDYGLELQQIAEGGDYEQADSLGDLVLELAGAADWDVPPAAAAELLALQADESYQAHFDEALLHSKRKHDWQNSRARQPQVLRRLRASVWSEYGEREFHPRKPRGPYKEVFQQLGSALARWEADRDLVGRVLGPYKPTEPYARSFPEPIGYVRRTQHHETFSRARQRGATKFVFYGLPGYGKTTLAEAISSEIAAEDGHVAVLRMHDGKILKTDLWEAFMASGQSRESRNSLTMEQISIARLLSGTTPPKVIILDGAEAFDEVRRVLPRQLSCILIVTCEALAQQIPRDFSVLHIEEFSPSEGAQLVRSNVASLSVEEAAKLAKTLHCWPLLIEHACSLFSLSSSSVAQFCEQVDADASHLLDGVRVDEDTLSGIIKKLANRVLSENVVAYELLAIISHTDADKRIDSRFAKTVVELVLKRAIGQVEFLQAIDFLGRTSLVKAHKRSYVLISKGKVTRRFDSVCDRFIPPTSSPLLLDAHSLSKRLIQKLTTHRQTIYNRIAKSVLDHGQLSQPWQAAFGIDLRKVERSLQETIRRKIKDISDTSLFMTELHFHNLFAAVADEYVAMTQHRVEGLKMGRLVLLTYGPFTPQLLIDIDAQHRPSEGRTATIFGYEFRLVNPEELPPAGGWIANLVNARRLRMAELSTIVHTEKISVRILPAMMILLIDTF